MNNFHIKKENNSMRVSNDRKMKVSEISEKTRALNIFMNCLNTAFILLGIGFVLMKLNLDKMADAYSIALFVIAGLLVLISFGVLVMIKMRVEKAVGDDENDLL